MTKIAINGTNMAAALYCEIGGVRYPLEAGSIEYSGGLERGAVFVGPEDATARSGTDPVADIRRAVEMVWREGGMVAPPEAWCASCGADVAECACGVADAIRRKLAEDAHAAARRLLPAPPSPAANRRERRAAKARERRPR